MIGLDPSTNDSLKSIGWSFSALVKFFNDYKVID